MNALVGDITRRTLCLLDRVIALPCVPVAELDAHRHQAQESLHALGVTA